MTDSREEQVHHFADELTRTVRAVQPDSPKFTVDVTGTSEWLAAITTEDSRPVVLTIGGMRLLDLLVSYRCTISERHSWMLIETSEFGVRPHNGGEWLVRMDYVHRPAEDVPCAHLHVHAHRDAWTFLMTRDGAGSRRRTVRRRASAGRVPQLSDVHFPLGGPRLRPTLEDFLIMLIQDLGIDHEPDALRSLTTSREEWRRNQARAIISSSRDMAAEVLTELGWTVTPPPDHEPRTDTVKWMTRY